LILLSYGGERRSPATDVYSVGVILYEMVTGRKPFSYDESTNRDHSDLNKQRTHPAHQKKFPPDLRSLNPTLSLDLSNAILKALEKEPRKRYISMQEMFSALCRAARIQPEEIPERVILPFQPEPRVTASTLLEQETGVGIPVIARTQPTQAAGFDTGQTSGAPPTRKPIADTKKTRTFPNRMIAYFILGSIVLFIIAFFIGAQLFRSLGGTTRSYRASQTMGASEESGVDSSSKGVEETKVIDSETLPGLEAATKTALSPQQTMIAELTTFPATQTSQAATTVEVVQTLTPGEFGIGAKVKVIAPLGLNIRELPGTDQTVLFNAPTGEEFTIQEGPKEANGLTWWYLVSSSDANRKGWGAQNDGSVFFLEVINTTP